MPDIYQKYDEDMPEIYLRYAGHVPVLQNDKNCRFWKNLTEWVSENMTSREAFASKNEENHYLEIEDNLKYEEEGNYKN